VQQSHALGHRRIAYLAGPARAYTNTVRHDVLHAAAPTMDVEPVELGPFEPRYEKGARAADLVCAIGATTVIAYNDLIALGLVGQLTARGISVAATSASSASTTAGSRGCRAHL
jgi:DNA-binding LacI/PurR family transcriptional regulator